MPPEKILIISDALKHYFLHSDGSFTTKCGHKQRLLLAISSLYTANKGSDFQSLFHFFPSNQSVTKQSLNGYSSPWLRMVKMCCTVTVSDPDLISKIMKPNLSVFQTFKMQYMTDSVVDWSYISPAGYRSYKLAYVNIWRLNMNENCMLSRWIKYKI